MPILCYSGIKLQRPQDDVNNIIRITEILGIINVQRTTTSRVVGPLGSLKFLDTL